MDTVIYRIEWGDKGPFYNDKACGEIETYCHAIAKVYKQKTRDFFDNFIDYYTANAPSPHDNSVMSEYLCQDREGFVGFGFNSIKDLKEQLGLQYSLYQLQFKELFGTCKFKVKAYLVDWVAYNESETMFLWQSARLLEEAKSFEEFLTM